MKKSISLFLLITLLAFSKSLTGFAESYVETINQASVAAAGHRVIYEMNVGSFTQEGTFAAAMERLPELKKLGVDVVWLMPIYPRGGGINSPYAAKNFQQTNPAYGTIADLKALVDKAHELNMLVWLDWVPNHTATDADWVTTHPEYYSQVDGKMVHPNNYGDVYELNYYNPDLQNAMNDCLKFWIDQAGVDGYRCDYISSPTIPVSYWQTAIPLIKNYRQGKTITFLGETDIPRDRAELKTAGFDYDYAWQFQSSLADYGSAGNTSSRLQSFSSTLMTSSTGLTFARMLYLTNHDQNWNETNKTLTQKYGANRYPLTVFAYTLFGMPLIYNGQEVGGNQALNYFEDTKIDWTSTDAKMSNTIMTLTALKHAIEALNDTQQPTFLTVADNTNVLAYTRKVGNSEVLVILNMGNTAATVSLNGLTAGAWSCWLDSKTVSNGVSRKQTTFAASQAFSLEAKGYQVYVKGDFSEEESPAAEVYIPVLDQEDEVSIFFESGNNVPYSAWVWGDLGGGDSYCTNTSWPGDDLTYKGLTATGKYVYKYAVTKTSSIPSYLIISTDQGNSKIYDGVPFVNHGYYIEGTSTPAYTISQVTGIREVYHHENTASSPCYTLSGIRTNGNSHRSVYVCNHKTIVRN